MASSSKRKGDRFEREVVGIFEDHGYEAYRKPLSGAVQGFEGDVEVPGLFGARPIEIKYGDRVPRTIYTWLADNAALVMRRKRMPALIVMRLQDWLDLLGRQRT